MDAEADHERHRSGPPVGGGRRRRFMDDGQENVSHRSSPSPAGSITDNSNNNTRTRPLRSLFRTRPTAPLSPCIALSRGTEPFTHCQGMHSATRSRWAELDILQPDTWNAIGGSGDGEGFVQRHHRPKRRSVAPISSTRSRETMVLHRRSRCIGRERKLAPSTPCRRDGDARTVNGAIQRNFGAPGFIARVLLVVRPSQVYTTVT